MNRADIHASPFKDAVVPTPDQGGNHSSYQNGCDIKSGMKGTPGKVDEVTFVDVVGAEPGKKVSAGGIQGS